MSAEATTASTERLSFPWRLPPDYPALFADELGDQAPELWKPFIPVVLHTPNGPAPLPAFIDSGADQTVIPQRFMAHFGITEEMCGDPTVEGSVGGQERKPLYTYKPGLEATVGEWRIRLAAHFWARPQGYPILLGREDFFRYFRVTFDRETRTTTLEPYGEGMDLRCVG